MRERKSLGMKNLFSSPSILPDLQKFYNKLETIQAEQRHARYDLQQIQKQLQICVKGIALLVSTPEPDLESEDFSPTEDIHGGS